MCEGIFFPYLVPSSLYDKGIDIVSPRIAGDDQQFPRRANRRIAAGTACFRQPLLRIARERSLPAASHEQQVVRQRSRHLTTIDPAKPWPISTKPPPTPNAVSSCSCPNVSVVAGLWAHRLPIRLQLSLQDDRIPDLVKFRCRLCLYRPLFSRESTKRPPMQRPHWQPR